MSSSTISVVHQNRFSLSIFVFLLLGGGQVTIWGATEGERGGTSSSSVSRWSCWKKSSLISAAVSVAARRFLNSLPLKSIIKTRFYSIRASWPIFQKNFQRMKKKETAYSLFSRSHFFSRFTISQKKIHKSMENFHVITVVKQ